MSGIFGGGNESYGSLGMGAPDTGRGDAFDRQAAQRGYGISPSASGTEIELDAPSGRRIMPGSMVDVELGTPRGRPIPSGSRLDISAMSGLGAASKQAAAVAARIRQLRVERMRAVTRISAIDAELRRLGA